jgi:hypothetical protein
MAVPPAVVTEILPFVAAAGTIAVTRIDELTVKLALVPLNLTDVAPVSPVPLITTLIPTGPLVGLKLSIVGTTVKVPALVAVPPPVITEIFPVAASTGTVAVIWVDELTVKGAPVPLNLTAIAPVSAVPVITTLVRMIPLVGLKLVTVGETVKLLALVAVPPAVVTVILPVMAANGTVAVT